MHKKYHEIVSNYDCNDNVYMVGNLADLRRYDAVKHFELYCAKHDIHFDYFLKSTVTKNIKYYGKVDLYETFTCRQSAMTNCRR